MRLHIKEYIQFLSISLGSVGELETQALIARDTKLIDLKDYVEIERLSSMVAAMLTNLIKALKKKVNQKEIDTLYHITGTPTK